MSKFGKKSSTPTTTRRRWPKFWSYSRWGNYSKCPAFYGYAQVDKLPQPPSKAMDRGIAIHKEAEDFVKGRVETLSKDLVGFQEELIAIRDMGFGAEESWTVTKTWQVTHAKDWDHAWLRGKADASRYKGKTVDAIDHKTGRAYDTHAEQAEVLALLGFAIYPKATKVDEEFWYLDQGSVAEFSFKRSEVRLLKKKWNANAHRMLTDDVLKPTPGDACRWCPFRSDKEQPNGGVGPCHGWKNT